MSETSNNFQNNCVESDSTKKPVEQFVEVKKTSKEEKEELYKMSIIGRYCK